ncbi:MAG: efflux RND transporter periplasmic adaptor subunit [Bacteroidia bacterium]|nr:efflux RND transporter periplasmic adaptor subunit [Bacteroidia bacterium]
MKKKILIIAGIVIVAAVILLIIKPFSKKEAAYTFDTVKVERGSISNAVTATGTIEAITTVDVGTQVSGIIKKVYVDFNDNVKEGQLLAKIDETNLLEQLKQSQANLDIAVAQLNYQEATYKRMKALYEKQLVAEADYDQALFNYENAKASVVNSRSAVSRAKVNLDYATITSPIDGVVLNRAIEEGQTVAASFNTPTLFTIVNDLTQMEVQTSVDEADIGKVNEGQMVEFTVDAYPDLKFEGSVSQVRLQPVTTNNVVTYVVILNAPNPDKKLMPGMTASATIYVEKKDKALTLSGKAIRFSPDQEYLTKMMSKLPKGATDPDMAQATLPSGTEAGQMPDMGSMPAGIPPMGMFPGTGETNAKTKTVWVKDDKGGILPAMVTLGIENGSSVEIASGLNEGDEVVISMSGGTGKKSTSRSNMGPGGPMPF